jgi:hypothetical protein
MLRPRYAALGLARLLPFERVLVGVRSTEPGAFGGFHYPNQGYRHLQMRSLITTCGPIDRASPEDPELAALDLLRAYAHDCLHYGSYRGYRLRGGEVVRTQHGVNFRRHDGRTYSAPDLAGSPTTRNLGIVMEGACDREARAITRRTASLIGADREHGAGRFVFRDVTGTLTSEDMATLTQARTHPATTPGPPGSVFFRAMADYHRNVNVRYAAFLDEIGGSEAEELHVAVVRAMISGALAELAAWLDDRHGPHSFASIFRAPGYR